ncbi:Glycoside hydrolase family 18, catalytic domain [Dillenia turbinata]|uniref:Glycoside hydrolase family 18, catalytic domain n=1 Tax=Dillenia turbinata TaxID=194707 RepID=A0AAN8W974_9MAGN
MENSETELSRIPSDLRYYHKYGHILKNCPIRPSRPKEDSTKSKSSSKPGSSTIAVAAAASSSLASATIPNSNDELSLLPASELDNSHFDRLIPLKPLLVSPMASSVPSPSESSNSLIVPMPPMAPLEGIKGSASIFSSMAGDQGKRAAFIKSTAEVAREYGFDGHEIDWEFPKDAQDMSNLSLLISKWSTTVLSEAKNSNQPRLLLAAAVYFASNFFLGDGRSYPTDAIKDYLDFVNLMCYNYHGRWDTSKTGEHALLYDNTSKITPAIGVGDGENGIMSYNYIVKYNSNNSATVVYDNVTVSMYSYARTNWVGYDGPNLTQRKVDYAKAKALVDISFGPLIRTIIGLCPEQLRKHGTPKVLNPRRVLDPRAL